MFRIRKILLDNDYYLVTVGLFGAIKVTLKSRGVTYKANRFERTKLLDTLDELKKIGGSVEPNSKEFKEIVTHFAEALLGRGDARWQAYFVHSSPKDLIGDFIDSNNKNSENHKISQDNWMDGVDEALESLTQEEWEQLQDETAAQEIREAHKLSEPKIKQIDRDFDWHNAFGFCELDDIPALRFTTKNDSNDKALTPYKLHGRILHESNNKITWKNVDPTIVQIKGKAMSEDAFYEFADDYIDNI